jgi:hypothetical protein
MSMIDKHFEKQEPFIYQKPNIFASLWATPSPLAISTQDAEANKAKLIEHGTKLYDDLWRIMLTEILVAFFWGKLPSHDLQQSVQVIYSRRSLDLEFLGMLRPVLDAWPQKDGTNHSEAVKQWFIEQLYLEVSAIAQFAIMLILTSGQGSRFIKICVLRARFASQQAIQEMQIHSHHLSGGVPCQPASLLAHGRFAPVTRKEILSVIELSEQDIYKYEPALKAGTEDVPRFKFCSNQVFTAACGFFQNFSEPQVKDSIIIMAIEQAKEVHNTFPIMSLALPSVIVSSLVQFF